MLIINLFENTVLHCHGLKIQKYRSYATKRFLRYDFLKSSKTEMVQLQQYNSNIQGFSILKTIYMLYGKIYSTKLSK